MDVILCPPGSGSTDLIESWSETLPARIKRHYGWAKMRWVGWDCAGYRAAGAGPCPGEGGDDPPERGEAAHRGSNPHLRHLLRDWELSGQRCLLPPKVRCCQVRKFSVQSGTFRVRWFWSGSSSWIFGNERTQIAYCIALHCIALHCVALHCIALKT